MRQKLLFMTVLTTLLLAACNGNEVDQNVVYTTVYPVGYLVEMIADEHVIIKRVPGSQAHSDSIDWTPKEIIDMIDSDLIFYIGGGVDTYIPNNENSTFEGANTRLINLEDATTYNLLCVSDDHSHEEEHEHEEAEHVDEGVLETCESNKIIEDPHFWLDPVRMMEVAEYVRDILVSEFPEFTEEFNANYEVLESKLQTLHSEYEQMALEATKPIITTSLLFSYYHERYDIEIISMATTPHSGENIPGDIIAISEEALFHDIHHIVYEKNVNSPAADALFNELSNIEDYEVTKVYLHGLGSLITEEVDRNENYLSIMYDNLETLKAATK